MAGEERVVMASNRMAFCAILAAAIAVAAYYAYINTPDSNETVPVAQREMQVGGLGVGSWRSAGKGTPLSMAPELHFWAPGFTEPGYLSEDHPVITTKHRYPAIPGGNLSTVMHKGWGAFNQAPAANSEWFLNPPEVAVL